MNKKERDITVSERSIAGAEKDLRELIAKLRQEDPKMTVQEAIARLRGEAQKEA